jgi:hypothetical protein
LNFFWIWEADSFKAKSKSILAAISFLEVLIGTRWNGLSGKLTIRSFWVNHAIWD